MRRIAIALSKGGVGKTTTAVNLAAGLARSGKTVLLVDVDTQGQVARALGCEPPAGLAEFIQGEMSIEDANFLARDNLWLLSGGRSMAGLKRLITRKDFGGERTLAEAFDGLKDQYDYILMDTAPGWDALTINVLFYAQAVLTPVSLEVMTLQGLIDFSRSMTTIQRYRDDLTLKYVLPTFFDRRVKKSEEILNQLQDHYGDQLCQPIRYNVRLSEAPGYGQTIPSKPARKSTRRVRQTKPPRWEYIIVTFQDYKGWRPRFENGLQYKDWMNLPLMSEYINDLGAEGWELVSVSAGERMFGCADKHHAYFKRKGQ
jgi:chromosome partitioning protein